MSVKMSGGVKLDRQGGTTVTYGVSFSPNGASAPTTSKIAGKRSYSSIARTSLGKYTITFPDVGRLRNAAISVRSNSSTPIIAKFGNYSETAKTLEVYTYLAVPASKTVGLDLAEWRLLAAADVPNTAAIGGIISSNTTPTYLRHNVGTDISTKLTFAATVVTELQFRELDLSELGIPASTALTFTARGLMSGATDVTTGLTVKTAWGFGDTVTSTATTKFTNVVSNVTATIPSHAIIGSQNKLYIAIVPDAHGTDALTIRDMFLTITPLADANLVDLTEADSTKIMVTADMFMRKDK